MRVEVVLAIQGRSAGDLAMPAMLVMLEMPTRYFRVEKKIEPLAILPVSSQS